MFYYEESILLPEHASALGFYTSAHLSESAESGHAWLEICGRTRLYLLEFGFNMGSLFSSLLSFSFFLHLVVDVVSPPPHVVISI